jgi:hypothetical protein
MKDGLVHINPRSGATCFWTPSDLEGIQISTLAILPRKGVRKGSCTTKVNPSGFGLPLFQVDPTWVYILH